MFNLGFFGSHNATIAISNDTEILEVVEVERFTAKKNCALWFYYSIEAPYNIAVIHEIKRYFEEKYKVEKYENVVYNSVDADYYKIFSANNYIHMPHHLAHAYSGFYQTPYDKALVISADGGSDEGFFNIFLAEKNKEFIKLYSGKRDLAVPYGLLGHYIEDIRQEEIFWGNLVYAGKIMGLAKYGVIRSDYLRKIFALYNNGDEGKILKTKQTIEDIFQISNFRFSGEDAKDLAATNQFVFEYIFNEESQPFLKEYPNLPVVIVGGCGLNILNNTKLSRTRTVFVPPNPNDCGLAVGLLAYVLKPKIPIDVTYLGSPVWDRCDLLRVAYENNGSELDIVKLADYIISGNIVGVVRGRAEHGPRALGNRSIICNPSISGMKDILNAKVKGREYYRPFAPVVRLEDVNKYFEWEGESRWMSFCPKVKKEYMERLGAIVHVDGTARVQTVTREQNEFLYDLLTEIYNKTGIGVLLNTSFNIGGKPILNTYRDAIWMLENTQMDGLILEHFFIKK